MFGPWKMPDIEMCEFALDRATQFVYHLCNRSRRTHEFNYVVYVIITQFGCCVVRCMNGVCIQTNAWHSTEFIQWLSRPEYFQIIHSKLLLLLPFLKLISTWPFTIYVKSIHRIPYLSFHRLFFMSVTFYKINEKKHSFHCSK